MDISTSSHSWNSTDLSTKLVKYSTSSADHSPVNSAVLPQPSGVDTVDLSQEGLNLSRANSSKDNMPFDSVTKDSPKNLGNQEIEQLRKLKQRDTEVRTHEQTHLAAAGRYSQSGPSFTYQKGPDGKSYAVGGEVEIDMAKEKTPEETIKKMQTIRRAALAPASPSAADRSIASKASAMEAEARHEITLQTQEELLSLDHPGNPTAKRDASQGYQPQVRLDLSNTPNKKGSRISVYQ